MGAYCFFQSKPAVNFDKGGRSLTDSSPLAIAQIYFLKMHQAATSMVA